MTATNIAETIINTFNKGNSVFICGNGGSSTQASHFAAEFVNKYTKYNKPLPAYSLNDFAILTSIANDMGFKYVFSRQLEAYGKKGDLLIALSTSGNSPNVKEAQTMAKKLKMQSLEWPRSGDTTGQIQNYQLSLMHSVCAIVEEYYDSESNSA
jgi:D-sedoheptulose 7-phosphate isomerase